MENSEWPSHDNDEPYFSLNGHQFDYKMIPMSTIAEYTGAQYYQQKRSIDEDIMANLQNKEESLKGLLTTEEFKAIVLDVNAINWTWDE